MKHRLPQFDLPGAENAFNLFGETAEDPNRLAAEARAKAAAEEDRRKAESRQTDLFPNH